MACLLSEMHIQYQSITNLMFEKYKLRCFSNISVFKTLLYLNPFSELICRDAVISSKDYAVALRKTVACNSPGLQHIYIHLHLFLNLYLLPNIPLTPSGPSYHPPKIHSSAQRILCDRSLKTYYLTLASDNRRYAVGSVT
jgi:hypothetical protein